MHLQLKWMQAKNFTIKGKKQNLKNQKFWLLRLNMMKFNMLQKFKKSILGIEDNLTMEKIMEIKIFI